MKHKTDLRWIEWVVRGPLNTLRTDTLDRVWICDPLIQCPSSRDPVEVLKISLDRQHDL